MELWATHQMNHNTENILGEKKIENFLMTENSPHQALGRMASFPLYIKAGDKQVISTDSGLQILSFGSDIPFV